MEIIHQERTVCIQLPIGVIMGDMPFLNKVVLFKAGISLQSCACCLCNIILDKCDDPYKPYNLTHSFNLIQDIQYLIHPHIKGNLLFICFTDTLFFNFNQ